MYVRTYVRTYVRACTHVCMYVQANANTYIEIQHAFIGVEALCLGGGGSNQEESHSEKCLVLRAWHWLQIGHHLSIELTYIPNWPQRKRSQTLNPTSCMGGLRPIPIARKSSTLSPYPLQKTFNPDPYDP